MLNIADATSRLVCWWLCSIEFDFEIVHTAGIDHQAADALSRAPMNGSDSTMLENDIHIIVFTRSNKRSVNSATVSSADVSHAEINKAVGTNLPTLLNSSRHNE